MITSIELQVISKILTSDNEDEINTLCGFDTSYYSVFKEHADFILNHRQKYGTVPDVFTFQSEYPDVTLVHVAENLSYLTSEMKRNKQHIILLETFNKLKDLGSGDVSEAWRYLSNQCERVFQLDESKPMNIIQDAKIRAEQVKEFNQQARIPTGFNEIDKVMYGGLSTVEELLLIIARTNTGKSWVCTKMMESAQKNGFPVLYYSPEMQSAFLGTRFDTWRSHFKNSQLHRGNYTQEYLNYLDKLSSESVGAYILEDKDAEDNNVNVRTLESLVRRYGIKLLIVDGLSYMTDVNRSDTDYVKYKNICTDLFKLSKKFGCAVVIAMQANRETKDIKDDKGEPMPTLYNCEGSDHPGRIATQAFSLRQVFDKHVLDIRLEKSRNAANQKPIFSYTWDPDTGNMQYIPGDSDASNSSIPSAGSTTIPAVIQNHISNTNDINLEDSDDEFDDVDF